jgi:RHS repeat-associated protein
MGRIKQKGDMSFEFGPEGRHRKAVRNGRTVANYEYDENLHLIFKEKIEGPSTYYFEGLITDGSSLLETVKVNGIVVGILVNGNFVFKPHDLRSTAMPDGRDPREWLEAYGIKNGGAIDLAFDYAGLPRDSDTGWIIMGARFYEPPLGRFLTPDPLLLEDLEKCAENPSECNLYSYARNNPLKYTDPSGLCTVGCHPEHQGPVTYRDGDPQLVGKTWDRLNNAAAEYLAISSYAAQSHDPAASLRSLRDTFLLSTPLEWSYAAGNGVLRSGAPLSGKQFVKGKENIQSFSTLNEARSAGRTMSGISDNAIDFVQEIGPYKGQVTGRMSPDGRQGWRIDFDESKGFHVNWWNKSEGSKRSQWIYGANKIEGGTVDDFKSLLDHGFPKK